MRRRTYTVEGAGHFPVDMLRYDDSWPANSVDADSIQNHPALLRRYSVQLETHNAHAPTVGRWNSFGWRVTVIEGKQVKT